MKAPRPTRPTVPALDPAEARPRRAACGRRCATSAGLVRPPAAFYRYSPDRKAEQARALLAGCRGFLHADGYAASPIFTNPNRRLAFPA